jgi:hypothetical protein
MIGLSTPALQYAVCIASLSTSTSTVYKSSQALEVDRFRKFMKYLTLDSDGGAGEIVSFSCTSNSASDMYTSA